MTRRLLDLAAALSLLLFIASAVLWVRSFCWAYVRWGHAGLSVAADHSAQRWCGAWYAGADSSAGVELIGGEPIRVMRFAERWPDPFFGFSQGRWNAGLEQGQWLGLRATLPPNVTVPPDFRYCYVVVPNWLPVVVSSLLPGASLARKQCQKRRSSRGFCASCGYDLRATPDRCPECGHFPEKSRPTT